MGAVERRRFRGAHPSDFRWLYAAICVLAAAFAFVGLSAGGYWTDELFTAFVIDHSGGLPEVFARALTDTHPPGYYVVLYGWTRLFGQSESAVRALSGLLCVAAIAVLLSGARRVFSDGARLFSAAAIATSPFWFVESQEARSYGLCLFVSAVVTTLALGARTAVVRGKAIHPVIIAGLCVVGAFGASIHFYEFLTIGVVYFFLIVTIPSLPLRIALSVTGALIFILEVSYISLLLGHTHQNIHSMWFQNDIIFFLVELWEIFKGLLGPGAAAAVCALVTVMAFSRRSARPSAASRSSAADWGVWMAVAVIAGVIVVGVAVSLLFAPSFSARNVLVASPFAWPALARLYDGAQERARPSWRLAATAIPAAALAAQAALQFARWLPRDEPWRESAKFVLATPGCRDQLIPVVLPARFAPPTPFYRSLLARYFYGYYFAGDWRRLKTYRAVELTDDALDPYTRRRLHPGAADSACPILAWAVHDIDVPAARLMAAGLAAAAGVPGDGVKALAFVSYRQVWGYFIPTRSAFVFLATNPPIRAETPRALPPGATR